MSARRPKPRIEPDVPATEPAPLRRPDSLGNVVYDAILERLISKTIMPGERISVDELVRQLGVSQTPIREALTRLEAQGVVVKTHLVGYRAAAEVDADQFQALFDARFLLEPYCAARAASRIGTPDLDLLEGLMERAEAIGQNPGAPGSAQLARIDTQFHRVIALASGNSVISDMIDALQIRVQFALLRHRARALGAKAPTAEHRVILQALKKRDPASAESAMRQHLQSSRNRYWPPIS